MLRKTSVAVGFAALLGTCALQGCSSAGTNQASPGSSQTDSGSPAASSGSPAVSSSTAAASPSSSPTTSSTSGTTSTVAPKATYSRPVAIPTATSAASGGSGGGSGASSGSFIAPAATSAVEGWGTYKKISASLVHVQVCAKKVGSASAVGVEAIAYNSDYSQQGEIASVILPQTPGQEGCTQTTLFYTAHLKVYSFIGTSTGTISQKSEMKSIY
jgi:hypothetical protein